MNPRNHKYKLKERSYISSFLLIPKGSRILPLSMSCASLPFRFIEWNKLVNYICPIHHFIFVFFLYFFYHSSCRRDHSTVLILKFGIEDITDLGLPKIRMSLTGLSLWFCLHKCF